MNNKVIDFIKHNKVHVAIWTIGFLIFAFFLYQKLVEPSYLFRGFMLNTEVESQDNTVTNLTKNFIQKYDIDTAQGEVLLDNSHTLIVDGEDEKKESSTSSLAYEMFSAQSTKTLNFTCGPTDAMKKIVYESYAGGTPLFAELDSLLSEDELKIYESHFLYVDYSVIDQLKEAYKNDKDTSSIELPDMTKPEKMKNPVPVLIDISNSPKLAEIYGAKNGDLAFGIMDGLSSHLLSLNFAEYVLFVEEE